VIETSDCGKKGPRQDAERKNLRPPMQSNMENVLQMIYRVAFVSPTANLKKVTRVILMLNSSRRLVLLVAGSMAVAAPGAFGQGDTPVPPLATTDVRMPTFDVVSVKASKSGGDMAMIRFKPDGFSATKISLKELLSMTSGIEEDLVSGLPSWASSARYDIDAKVAGPDVEALKKLSREQRSSMIQSALADRFKLKVHTEIRQLPVFALVVQKSSPRLKEATPGDAYANGIKAPGGVSRAGMMMMKPGEFIGQGIPISTLAGALSQHLQRTVIDKTGLTGKYDIALEWTADNGADPMIQGTDGSQQRAETATDVSGLSIFTAIQEQLGLKLQSTKGPVETLIVDHVEMPTEN
jgi:uncharacterized protein (TIGR03435 family)